MHPDREIYGYPAERHRLARQWAAVDRKLEALRELPVGETDPAERDWQLFEDLDRIEHEIGRVSVIVTGHSRAMLIAMPETCLITPFCGDRHGFSLRFVGDCGAIVVC